MRRRIAGGAIEALLGAAHRLRARIAHRCPITASAAMAIGAVSQGTSAPPMAGPEI